jgi:hypothetical protein
MTTDTKEKTYTQAEYTALQTAKDREIAAAKKEARDARKAQDEAEEKYAEIEGKYNTLNDKVKELELEPDAAARLKKLADANGELDRKTKEFNNGVKKFRDESKPIKELALKQTAAELAGKSKGQFTVEKLLEEAEGDEGKMRDFWINNYNPDVTPPVTQPGPDEQGKVKNPGLPPGGGTPPTSEKTDEQKLDERYPTMK